ncbi:hypothetical protein BaRGS_00009981 [Batillaria attramentaria]|uniref:Uncharacterized protein n=1 Tax=Batillaria attramentaria TaxID=370345 RepID=A0ABD0LHC9_9CAEN
MSPVQSGHGRALDAITGKGVVAGVGTGGGRGGGERGGTHVVHVLRQIIQNVIRASSRVHRVTRNMGQLINHISKLRPPGVISYHDHLTLYDSRADKRRERARGGGGSTSQRVRDIVSGGDISIIDGHAAAH